MTDEDASKLMPFQNSVTIVSKPNYSNNTTDMKAELKDAHIPLGERSKAVKRQQLMVFLGNIGAMGSGMVISMPAVTLTQLTDAQQPFVLDSGEASWFASINNMACPLGGLFVGFLLDRFGRKNTIQVTNLIGVLGWLLLATAFLHSEREWIYAQLLVGRALGGILVGMFFSPLGVYSAEISLPRIRGKLVLGSSIALACGILYMYLLGYFIRSNFVLIATISCIYQLISMALVLPLPESPSWLLQKGHVERARRSLRYFRGLGKKDGEYVEEFEAEFAQMKINADNSRETASNESLAQLIRRPEVYKPIFLMIGFFGFQQVSGVVIIIVYAVQISQRAGATMDPFLVAVMLGAARIIMTCLMTKIFESYGRKPCGMFSATGMGICMLLLAAGGWFPDTVGSVTWLPVVCIVVNIIFSVMGILTLPFYIVSEVFPQSARGSASGIAVFFSMIIGFIMLKTYPAMEATLGTSNNFAFYAAVSFLAIGFIYYCMPETRGRTLMEIEEYWRTGKLKPLGGENLKDVELTEIFLKK